MRVLVTGARGMLARALIPVLWERGHEVVALGRADLDVTDSEAVSARISAERPAAVVQCAAYTAVDQAETEEAEAFRINADGTRHLALACQQLGARLVYPSTDYVFSGDARRPYLPTDPPQPVNAYGRSKWAGERAAMDAAHALVVRTSWLYGEYGRNFVHTVTQRARESAPLRVVADQIGRPTWTGSFALVLAELLEKGAEGIFHASDGGPETTWFEFARAVLEAQELAADIVPVPTMEYPRPARRPAYSMLDLGTTEEVLQRPLPDWRDSLRTCLGVAPHEQMRARPDAPMPSSPDTSPEFLQFTARSET